MNIHCNRFPSFSELNTEAREEWIEKAIQAEYPDAYS